MQCKKYGYGFSGDLDFWDLSYYSNLIVETEYSVDKEALRAYFPIEKVTRGLLEIYQLILGLKFTEVIENADIWHEDVKLVSFKSILKNHII